MDKNQANLIWIDCEFTGLDFLHNKIVEIAVVVTDSDLNVLGDPVQAVVHHTQAELDDLLEDWPREQFAKSGLTREIVESEVSMRKAEDMCLEYISQHCSSGQSPLCGNSVGQDRRVLYTNMPRLERFLHYRNIDVSTLKELALLWNPGVLDQISKKESHRALEDIYESIAELKIYKEYFVR